MVFSKKKFERFEKKGKRFFRKGRERLDELDKKAQDFNDDKIKMLRGSHKFSSKGYRQALSKQDRIEDLIYGPKKKRPRV